MPPRERPPQRRPNPTAAWRCPAPFGRLEACGGLWFVAARGRHAQTEPDFCFEKRKPEPTERGGPPSPLLPLPDPAAYASRDWADDPLAWACRGGPFTCTTRCTSTRTCCRSGSASARTAGAPAR